jgi:NADPH:quinone reductase-like Zn-dependent oxidoreductase
MKQISQETVGGPEVLELRDVERPEPIPTEVLVRVHAAGVNPVDWKVRAKGGFLGEPPFSVGWDVSGVVEEVAAGVTRFAVGDEVFGMPWFPREVGAYAEYVTAPSRQFARKPASIDHLHAAGLPLASLTAWQALVDTADVQPGQKVLVHAAAGGVGHLAVQIVKARGAYVLGTARAEKHDFLRSLGVDEPIDYTTTPVEAMGEGLDVVLDLIGGETGVDSVPLLRPDGLLIPVPSGAGQSVLDAARQAGVRATGILVEPDGASLTQIAKLVDDGALRVEIDSVFPLSDAARAHERGETGRARGKIVLDVAG